MYTKTSCNLGTRQDEKIIRRQYNEEKFFVVAVTMVVAVAVFFGAGMASAAVVFDPIPMNITVSNVEKVSFAYAKPDNNGGQVSVIKGSDTVSVVTTKELAATSKDSFTAINIDY